MFLLVLLLIEMAMFLVLNFFIKVLFNDDVEIEFYNNYEKYIINEVKL